MVAAFLLKFGHPITAGSTASLVTLECETMLLLDRISGLLS